MIVRQEITCPCCESEFTIEFNLEVNPNGAEICPFCEDFLPKDESLVGVDDLMED